MHDLDPPDNDLEAILGSIWAQLMDSAGKPGTEWGLPVLASVGQDGSPRQRTVVLRAVDRERYLLYCYTDSRAAKAAEIMVESYTSWLFYDRQQRVQVVMSGPAVVRTKDEFVIQAWKDCPPESRANYNKPDPPGTPIPQARSGHAKTVNGASDGSESHSEVTQQHFAVITARIEFIDWLRLLPDGNLRAQFQWTGSDWGKRWVTP